MMRAPLLHGRPDRACRVGTRSSRIDEECRTSAEEEIQKRLFEIRAARLAKDDEVRVVVVSSEFRIFRTRSTREPRGGKRATRDAVAISVRDLERDYQRKDR